MGVEKNRKDLKTRLLKQSWRVEDGALKTREVSRGNNWQDFEWDDLKSRDYIPELKGLQKY